MNELAYVVSHGDEAVTDAVVRTLERDGWTVVQSSTDPYQAVNGVVYIPGLLEDNAVAHVDPATALLDLVESLRSRFPSATDGGARVAAVGSRDWLGWPRRPHWWRWCEAVRSRTARPASRSTV